MSNNEMNAKAQELRELLHMAEEINAEIEAIKNNFKEYMYKANIFSLSGFDWSISYKDVRSSRLDTAAIKRLYPDIAAAHTISSTTKRFTFK